MTDFLTRLIGRSSWSLPLAEPVMDPLFSPRHEAHHLLEIDPSETERVVPSSSSAGSMTDGMGFRARGTSSLTDNDGVREGKLHQIAHSWSGAKPIGNARSSVPAIPQTGERVHSPPLPFAPAASENNLPEQGGKISKEHLDDTPPGRLEGKPSETERAHISARMKGLENSPAYGIDNSQSQIEPVDSRSVPITVAASRNLMAENWHEPILKIARDAEDGRGSEVLTAQPIERSASRSRSRISDWERPGQKFGDEKKRTGPSANISEQPQLVRVTIGRIDVRAVTRQQPAKPTPPAPDRVPSLEEYMRKRNGGIR